MFAVSSFVTSIIMAIIIGGIAGWAAGQIMKSNGSLVRNIILGIVGAFVGNLVLGLIGIHGSGFLGSIIVSTIGACIVIYLGRVLSK
ncbi:GlsB/YeaQ/YmgE family stress response membrane protein [Butyrivibrio sp. X503]|uniref:GlsB/YeaQ/YmgE family stress response membrane protein n=1 Tax=Butyrivibrio sp. X503 TaxID=2364878 RepID=UPI000EA86DA1|nr:GlsB/YeaQ/YmgE family stress response membrane protein [Butyrivibrio sp. X503]RKM54906.1 GlsB/YeaQ/YmgE family stress response membrane protein [Butyrivibrio sp. X503]